MPNPSLIGGDFLGTHVFPIFYLTSAIARILPAMPYAVWFCVWFSLWLPLLWWSVDLLLGGAARLPPLHRASLSLVLTLNGLALSMLGFPHIESFIPPLLVFALVGLTQPGASGPPLASSPSSLPCQFGKTRACTARLHSPPWRCCSACAPGPAAGCW